MSNLVQIICNKDMSVCPDHSGVIEVTFLSLKADSSDDPRVGACCLIKDQITKLHTQQDDLT